MVARKGKGKSIDPDFWQEARDWLHYWLPKAQNVSPQTVRAYQTGLECYINWCEQVLGVIRDEFTFSCFNPGNLKQYLVWMSNSKHYSERTIRLRMSAIRSFLDHSANTHPILVPLAQSAKSFKTRPPKVKPIDFLKNEQLQAILEAWDTRTVKSRRNRMLLILLYETGARVSELTKIDVGDLVLDDSPRVFLTGKGSKTRVVPLSNKVVDHLQVYLREFHPDICGARDKYEPLFYSYRDGVKHALTADMVRLILHQAVAKVSGEVDMPARVYCHLLRKTRAMDMYQQGVPLPIIMQILGHASMSTTSAFYAFATLDMMRDAVNSVNPGPDPKQETWLSEQRLRALRSLR